MMRTIALLMSVVGLVACSSLPRQLASPRVELVELRLLQASFDGQRFAVRLVLDNPNPVPIPVVARMATSYTGQVHDPR